MALAVKMLNLSPTRIEEGLCNLVVRFAGTRKAGRLILHCHIAF